MKLKLLGTESSVRSKLNQIFSDLIQFRCRKEPLWEFEDECIKK